jgi:hypothetical protein
MERPSVLILLIFAFAGGNLLVGIASNARSIKNTGTRTGRFLFLPLITFFVHLLFFFFFLTSFLEPSRD